MEALLPFIDDSPRVSRLGLGERLRVRVDGALRLEVDGLGERSRLALLYLLEWGLYDALRRDRPADLEDRRRRLPVSRLLLCSVLFTLPPSSVVESCPGGTW